MNTQRLLEKLCAAFGPSGGEGGVNAVIKKIFSDKKTATDAAGNLAVEIEPRKAGAPVIMLTAHTDEISFMVNDVNSDGTLSLATVGGIDLRGLYASRVTLHAASGEFDGVITSGESEPDKNVVADIGYPCEDSPAKPGGRVGFYRPMTELADGYVAARSIDDRIGCAVIIKAAEQLAKGLSCGVYLLFAVQEEIGERGSGVGAFNINPTVAIAVDGSFGDAPFIDADKTGKMLGGPMIGVSPILDDEYTDILVQIAKRRRIPYQKEIMGGATGTDGDRISAVGGGIRTALVSVPMRNMHTPAETAYIKDIDSSAKLIAAFVNELGGKADV